MTGVAAFLGQLRVELKASWAIAKKDMRIYYIRPGTLMFGILFPFFLWLSFAVARDSPAAALVPGLIAITVLFCSSSIGPMAIPTERRTKTYERMLCAPISNNSILFGKTMGGGIYGFGVGIVPLLAGVAFLDVRVETVVILVAGIFVSAFCFSALGIMFASFPTENPGDVMMALNFVRLPLLFISGVFISLERLPEWGQTVALISPLTYANDAIRWAIEGETHYGAAVDLIVLLGFAALFFLMAARLQARFRG